jgi:hypothetical protein
VLLLIWHDSMAQLIAMQSIAMALLLIVLGIRALTVILILPSIRPRKALL